MILDRLSNAHRYTGLHPRLAAAFSHLQRTDLAELPDGRHELAPDGGLFALHEHPESKGQGAARLEVHRRNIDVQYSITGHELIGWRSLSECEGQVAPFDPARDIGFYTEPPIVWIPVPPGYFVIFFPEDAHAPLAGAGRLHKVVVKMAVK